MMNIVIDKLNEVFSASPAFILNSGRLGAKKPSAALEVPAIVVSLTIENNRISGIGRYAGPSNGKVIGESYDGLMILEIWANGFSEVDEISRQIQVRLESNPALLRQKGFLKLQPANLEAAENVLHEPPLGTPFSVWKQKLSFKFVFEAEEGGESEGIAIKRIDVDMNKKSMEPFSIP